MQISDQPTAKKSFAERGRRVLFISLIFLALILPYSWFLEKFLQPIFPYTHVYLIVCIVVAIVGGVVYLMDVPCPVWLQRLNAWASKDLKDHPARWVP
jgi:hypothetical protein